MTILEFLTARLDEDEKQLRTVRLIPTGRFLRDIEGKRNLIDFAFRNAAKIDGEWGDCHSPDQIRAGMCSDYGDKAAHKVLVLLAWMFADRPDFDPAWSVA